MPYATSQRKKAPIFSGAFSLDLDIEIIPLGGLTLDNSGKTGNQVAHSTLLAVFSPNPAARRTHRLFTVNEGPQHRERPFPDWMHLILLLQ